MLGIFTKTCRPSFKFNENRTKVRDTLFHRSPTVLWQGDTLVIVACSRAARGKITLSGIPNFLNYCVVVMVYTQVTIMATGLIKKPNGPQVGDPCII
jgi:hypothetical protein